MIELGYTLDEMADEMFMSRSSLYRFCVKHDLDVSRRTLSTNRFMSHFSKFDIDRIVNLYKSQTVAHISRVTGYNEYTINKVLKEKGLKK